MIDVKELRIGNLVYFDKDYYTVSIIEEDKITRIRRIDFCNEVVGVLQIKPIELTEGWLLKFGFISNPYDDVYELDDFNVHCDKCTGTLMLYCVINNKIVDLKTVHQLQNLYYALTGEELTTKQKQT